MQYETRAERADENDATQTLTTAAEVLEVARSQPLEKR
jgi:hypothetical protein